MPVLALPKGRYLARSQVVANYFGVTPQDMWPNGPGLIEGNICAVLLAKARDVPRLVDGGFVQVGVAPQEWIFEYEARYRGAKIANVGKLDWPASNLEWLAPNQNDSSPLWPPKPRSTPVVVTAFRGLALASLREQGITAPEILKVGGSVEPLALLLGALAFDCVETGRTADVHNLRRVHTVFHNLRPCVIVHDEGPPSGVEAIVEALFAPSLRRPTPRIS